MKWTKKKNISIFRQWVCSSILVEIFHITCNFPYYWNFRWITLFPRQYKTVENSTENYRGIFWVIRDNIKLATQICSSLNWELRIKEHPQTTLMQKFSVEVSFENSIVRVVSSFFIFWYPNVSEQGSHDHSSVLSLISQKITWNYSRELSAETYYRGKRV